MDALQNKIYVHSYSFQICKHKINVTAFFSLTDLQPHSGTDDEASRGDKDDYNRYNGLYILQRTCVYKVRSPSSIRDQVTH